MITAKELRDSVNTIDVIKRKLSFIEHEIKSLAANGYYDDDFAIVDDEVRAAVIKELVSAGFKVTVKNSIVTVDWSK